MEKGSLRNLPLRSAVPKKTLDRGYDEDMKELPLFDEDAPIACTLSEAALSGRLDQLQLMRSKLRQLDRTSRGMVLRFDPDPHMEKELDSFALEEKQCCGFWGFDVQRSAEDLTLVWEAPPSAQLLIDQLSEFFQGIRPPEFLSGLL